MLSRLIVPNSNLKRFHDAQQGVIYSLPKFDLALQEIQGGRKKGHWIWYIFPQLKALGLSTNAKSYGIADLAEACSYLADPVLFANYLQITQEIAKQMQRTSLTSLMNGRLDAQKLMSSLTLFKAAALEHSNPSYQQLGQLCDTVFGLAAKEHLYPCAKTLSLIVDKRQPPKTPDVPMKTAPLVLASTPIVQQPLPKPKKGKDYTALITQLDGYVKQRANEWSFHYNFLGLVAIAYFIHDLLLGTDYYNNKSRAIKMSAAGTLKEWLNSSNESKLNLTASESQALGEGRLGDLIRKHGGLETIVANKPSSEPSEESFKLTK